MIRLSLKLDQRSTYTDVRQMCVGQTFLGLEITNIVGDFLCLKTTDLRLGCRASYGNRFIQFQYGRGDHQEGSLYRGCVEQKQEK